MGRWMKVVKVLINNFLKLLYPNVCLLCQETMAYQSEELLCEDCKGDYPVLKGDLCEICGKPLQDLKKPRCFDCRHRLHFYDEGCALWVYEDKVKEAIYQYKYKNKRELGVMFAKALARYYNEYKGWQVDMVIPVPLHPMKYRKRGFNQSELLGKHLANIMEVPFKKKVLKRHKNTIDQKHLTDKERILNMRTVFKVVSEDVTGCNVLLVDDVYTTGATIDGCAKSLIDAGAKNIYYICIAIGRGY